MEFTQSIFCDENAQIICITTKYAILLFETTRIAFELKIDSFPPDLTGIMSNCKVLYNTRILGFVLQDKEEEKKAKEANTELRRSKTSKSLIEPNQTLIIMDIEYNRILGKIKIKGKIDDYELTKNFIIIKKKSLNKVFLFKTATLEYFTTIENVNLGKIRYNENIQLDGFISPTSSNIKISASTPSTKDNEDLENNNQNKINTIDESDKDKEHEKNENLNKQNEHFCILAYQDYKNKKEVVLIEYKLDSSRKNILDHRKRTFIPNFNAVGVKFIYLIESYLLISSNIGNKLHIYDVSNFKLLHCIFLGDFPYDLTGIRLNNDKTIISVITNNKYIKLYKLNLLSKKCLCLSHDDTKVSFNKKRNIFEVIKHKINSGITPFWCKFKINFDDNDQMNNDSVVIFDENNNRLLYVVQKNCTLKKFDFDPSRPNNMRLSKTMKLSEFYRYDMESEMKV